MNKDLVYTKCFKLAFQVIPARVFAKVALYFKWDKDLVEQSVSQSVSQSVLRFMNKNLVSPYHLIFMTCWQSTHVSSDI